MIASPPEKIFDLLADPSRHHEIDAIWRYELEPLDDGTRVRETWDISHEAVKAPVRLGMVRDKTRQAMEHTLENIEKICAG